MNYLRLALFLCLVSAGFLLGYPRFVYAETTSAIQAQIDANNKQLEALQATVTSYQKQLNTLGEEKNTLQSAISALTLTQKKLTTQIQATQNKIASANLQIQRLTLSIGDKEDSIEINKSVIAKQLRSMTENEQTPFIASILSSSSFGDAWRITDETIQMNDALMKSIKALSIARATLTSNRTQMTAVKASLLSLQKDLSNQKSSVNASKIAEQNLLAQTKNQESTYQKLLKAAKAELASFSTFTTNAGGSKLLANQTSCDSWGCYYSQRDTLWGNVRLNGARSNLASEGCLVTSMAMVLTHYGHRNVTPVAINADSGNFSPFGGLLLFVINVDGVTATRKTTTIDATLATGNPVIVGVHAYGGTHFVVLTSGSRGSYLMRDPYVANGKDINFTSHYSIGSIYAINKVIVSN